MALVHELEKSGNWLFRRRSWLPVVFIAAGIAALYLTNRQAIIFNLTPELLFPGSQPAWRGCQDLHRGTCREKHFRAKPRGRTDS